MNRLYVLCALWWVLAWSAPADGASMRGLHKRALSAYQSGKYERARRSFRRLLRLSRRAQSKQKRGSRVWHIWTLGQIDIHGYLGQIALLQQSRGRACAHFGLVHRRLRGVPSNWKQWGLSTPLLIRIQRAHRMYRLHCVRKAPGKLRFLGSPRSALLQWRDGQRWRAITRNPWPSPKPRVTVRISAPGYHSKVVRDVQVKAGQTRDLRFQLQAKKAAPPPPKPAPQGKPWYQQPVTWIVAGAVVGGALLTVVIVAATSGSGSPDEKFRSHDGNGAFRLWSAK